MIKNVFETGLSDRPNLQNDLYAWRENMLNIFH